MRISESQFVEPAPLNGTHQSDLERVVTGIKKLPEGDVLEVSLCLLNLKLKA